jgi:tRNA 2-thiouridine synthesizing protein A
VTSPGVAARLDVRADACPMTWVKTRIALERLSAGDRLEVLLSPGEPAESVPRSAAEDGHLVVALDVLGAGEGVRLVLEKADGGGEEWR